MLFIRMEKYVKKLWIISVSSIHPRQSRVSRLENWRKLFFMLEMSGKGFVGCRKKYVCAFDLTIIVVCKHIFDKW